MDGEKRENGRGEERGGELGDGETVESLTSVSLLLRCMVTLWRRLCFHWSLPSLPLVYKVMRVFVFVFVSSTQIKPNKSSRSRPTF